MNRRSKSYRKDDVVSLHGTDEQSCVAVVTDVEEKTRLVHMTVIDDPCLLCDVGQDLVWGWAILAGDSELLYRRGEE